MYKSARAATVGISATACLLIPTPTHAKADRLLFPVCAEMLSDTLLAAKTRELWQLRL